ncbi:hypothetical protein, partial [Stenotrophomonas maltophilia]|uniref:hypothetical protein n=1 Tax=Stenotrophomonas maltophilia TaxID=40324 RepID=UPI001952A3F8
MDQDHVFHGVDFLVSWKHLPADNDATSEPVCRTRHRGWDFFPEICSESGKEQPHFVDFALLGADDVLGQLHGFG